MSRRVRDEEIPGSSETPTYIVTALTTEPMPAISEHGGDIFILMEVLDDDHDVMLRLVFPMDYLATICWDHLVRIRHAFGLRLDPCDHDDEEVEE